MTELSNMTFQNNTGTPPGITVDVKACARCGGNHVGLQFYHLAGGPIYCSATLTLTHYATCPVTMQPILMGKDDLSNLHVLMDQ